MLAFTTAAPVAVLVIAIILGTRNKAGSLMRRSAAAAASAPPSHKPVEIAFA